MENINKKNEPSFISMTRSAIAFVFLSSMVLSSFGMPQTYNDDRLVGCHSFVAEHQGTCNACAATALTSALGLRACIQGGRNVRFSPQQIWDCFGGDCNAEL